MQPRLADDEIDVLQHVKAQSVDYPSLEDDRWDRLLGAVLGQAPTTAAHDAPLATTFPVPMPGSAPAERAEPQVLIDLDASA